MGVYDVDKPQLMADVLRRHGANVHWRQGWQSISCPVKHKHMHGDKNKSASLNMSSGYLNCHGCGFTGDGFDLMLELEGTDAEEVRRIFNTAEEHSQPSGSATFTFARRDQ